MNSKKLIHPIKVFCFGNCDDILQSIFTTKVETNNAIKSIREKIYQIYGQNVAERVIIQYGGSMKPSNAKELLEMSDIDGGLIGGASLKAEDFSAIVNYNK